MVVLHSCKLSTQIKDNEGNNYWYYLFYFVKQL